MTTARMLPDGTARCLWALGLAAVGAGNTLGLGRWGTATTLVRRHPWLT